MQTNPETANMRRGVLGSAVMPPIPVPAGYVGPLALKGTGRMVWWTGRVAIGLRHEPAGRVHDSTESERWLQDLLCSEAGSAHH